MRIWSILTAKGPTTDEVMAVLWNLHIFMSAKTGILAIVALNFTEELKILKGRGHKEEIVWIAYPQTCSLIDVGNLCGKTNLIRPSAKTPDSVWLGVIPE